MLVVLWLPVRFLALSVLILLSFAAGAPSASALLSSVSSLRASPNLKISGPSDIGLSSAAARKLQPLALWLLDPHLLQAELELPDLGSLAGAHLVPESFSILTGGSAKLWITGAPAPFCPRLLWTE